MKILLIFFLGYAFSRELMPRRWDGLKVRFDIFNDMPRTEDGAVEEGFVKHSDCKENPKFRGKQYMKDEDTSVILLYDVNGYIAGIQSGIPKDLSNGFPSEDIKPPFVDDGDVYKLTAYFVDPLLICDRGRSKQQFELQGTGTDLFIQNGDNPEQDLMEISQKESDSSWVKGLCFPGMGFHYFLDLAMDMRCEAFFPVALLYYKGNLKGFVWSFGAILNSTVVPYEKPEPAFFEKLMVEVPHCLRTLRRSTLHVYLENDPQSYSCRTETSAAVAVCWMKTTLTTAVPFGLLLIMIKRLLQ